MATSPPPPPAPQPPSSLLREREREYNDSPTTKYLNSVDLYNVTPRRDSKTSNASLAKNDYYYDKENELYSTRKNERDLKLAPPREDREDLYEEQRHSYHHHQQHNQQIRTNTATRGSISYNTRLSPIMSSPTHDVTKTLYIF